MNPDVEETLHWYAFNYRQAHTSQAHEMWLELEQFVDRKMKAPQRTWVGLTEEDRAEILSRKWWDFEDAFDVDGFLRLAEAKLKEKNNA